MGMIACNNVWARRLHQKDEFVILNLALDNNIAYEIFERVRFTGQLQIVKSANIVFCEVGTCMKSSSKNLSTFQKNILLSYFLNNLVLKLKDCHGRLQNVYKKLHLMEETGVFQRELCFDDTLKNRYMMLRELEEHQETGLFPAPLKFRIERKKGKLKFVNIVKTACGLAGKVSKMSYSKGYNERRQLFPKVLRGFHFKGFGLSFVKPLRRLKSVSFGIRIPLTPNLPEWDRNLALPRMTSFVGISYPTDLRISLSVAFPTHKAIQTIFTCVTMTGLDLSVLPMYVRQLRASTSIKRIGMTFSIYYNPWESFRYGIGTWVVFFPALLSLTKCLSSTVVLFTVFLSHIGLPWSSTGYARTSSFNGNEVQYDVSLYSSGLTRYSAADMDKSFHTLVSTTTTGSRGGMNVSIARPSRYMQRCSRYKESGEIFFLPCRRIGLKIHRCKESFFLSIWQIIYI
jgi:hypothetical protein